MKQGKVLSHEFVDYIPPDLKEDVLYISFKFALVVHKCCCGCGGKVVTPLSLREWELIFNGETISLNPSIGNWGLGCRSHYWIKRSRVVWAPAWSPKEIGKSVKRDRAESGKTKRRGLRKLLKWMS